MFFKKTSSILFVALLLLLAAGSAFAQTQITTGVIQGVVMDETGAVMPGSTVTVRNLDTNFEQTQETDANGRFVFLQLRPGPYMVRVSQQGFSTLVVERTELTVGQTIPLSLNMKVSPVAEEITVSATPTVDIVKTESSSTLNELSVESTPVLGRKFEDLFTLTPGVSIVQGPDGDEINFVGQRGIFSNISVDGGDYINGFFGEQAGGQRTAIDLTMDAIKEFQVTATGGSAEFGRTGAGVVNVITKSGTNEVHGSLFYFQRHEKLSANDSQGNPLDGFEREQFGGTIGGPIVKDKAFGFFALEQIYSKLNRPNLGVQLGDTPCPQSSFTVGNLADEALIDTNFDCQRLALLEFFQSDRGSDEGQPLKKDDQGTSILGKFDWNVTPGNQFNASYNVTRSKNVNATFDVPTYGPSANGIEGTPSWIHSFRANLFSTVSPTMFNEGTFSYTRETRPRSTVESNIPADTGIGFFPSFRFGNPFFIQPTVDELFWRTQARDNFSIIAGTHTIKFGGEYIHSLNSQVFRGFFTSRYLFDSVVGFLRYTADPVMGPGFGPLAIGCDDGTFNDFFAGCGLASPTGGPLLFYLADGIPLAGAPAGIPPPGASSITNEELALFVQDKWQIRPNFTLSFGLRWEAQYMPETVDPSTTAYAQFIGASVPNVLGPVFPSDGTIPDQTDMWQPRIGFAWDVLNNGKSVFRASWGIYNARQNMLTQVGSVTTNGLQQRTNFVDSSFIGFVTAPVWPNTETGSAAPCPGNDPFPCFTGVRVFDRNYKNPRIYTGNVAFEQEIVPDWSVYMDFTLSNGTRLTRFLNINGAFGGGRTVDPICPDCLGDLFVTASNAQSNYNGLTFGMRKRFSKGYQLEWNYTWSKDQDDDSNERDPFTDRTITGLNPFVGPDPTLENFRADFGNSDRDIRHKFNFAGYFELPGTFILNARIQARSAQPVTDANRLSICAPVNQVCTGSPDIGRNTLRKDNKFFTFDWRLSRPFRWGDDRFAIEPIFEMFNTFNNDNNIVPSWVPGSVTAQAPGLFNFDGFLRQGVGDPLQVQLAVKFTF